MSPVAFDQFPPDAFHLPIETVHPEPVSIPRPIPDASELVRQTIRDFEALAIHIDTAIAGCGHVLPDPELRALVRAGLAARRGARLGRDWLEGPNRKLDGASSTPQVPPR